MRSQPARRAVVLTFLAALALPGRRAFAQTADASCQAVEQTEAMRNAGHYREARTLLLECVNAQCGGDVRRQCASTLQKLDAVTPSIVVRVEDEDGNDVTDVQVSVDGEPLVTSLDGMAIPVDPGEHRFVFTRPGREPVTKTVTIREGEKFRSVEVQLSAPAPSVPEPEPPKGTSASGPRLAGALSLLGVGVAGVAGFAVIGLDARDKEEGLDACKPNCPRGRVSGVRTRYWVANVSGGIGVLAAGAATWLLLSGSSTEPSEETNMRGWAFSASDDGAFATYSGAF